MKLSVHGLFQLTQNIPECNTADFCDVFIAQVLRDDNKKIDIFCSPKWGIKLSLLLKQMIQNRLEFFRKIHSFFCEGHPDSPLMK